MNIHHVNSTLGKAIVLIQEAQLEEAYVGSGGNFGTPANVMPSGDPDGGGDGGVPNYSSDVQAFADYMDDLISSVASQCGMSEGDARQAIVTCAAMKASKGLMPAMPSMSASAEALSTWAGAAATAGFTGMCIDYCLAKKGGAGGPGN